MIKIHECENCFNSFFVFPKDLVVFEEEEGQEWEEAFCQKCETFSPII